jgi:hypothetical protein
MIGLLKEMPLPSASLKALVYQQRLYPLFFAPRPHPQPATLRVAMRAGSLREIWLCLFGYTASHPCGASS